MTLSAQEKGDLARYRIEKAHGLLSDAATLMDASSYSSSSNRSYYAVLSAGRALLALRGQDPEMHEGVKVLLVRDFIKPGLLPHQLGEVFRVLQARRVDADYGDYIEIGELEAKDALVKAREFVQAASTLLEKLVKDSGVG